MTFVYVDTSALLPLVDSSSSDHEKVVKSVTRLSKQRVELLTTSYTLLETGALIRKRLGKAAFKALGEVAVRAMVIEWVNSDLHQRAWAAAEKEGKKGPSLVDWTGFLVMEDKKITTALALDRHFKKHGFKTLPG